MNWDEHFGKEDEFAAKREHLCCMALLKIIKSNLNQGDYYAAEQRIIDLTISNHELKKMHSKKRCGFERGGANEVVLESMQEL